MNTNKYAPHLALRFIHNKTVQFILVLLPGALKYETKKFCKISNTVQKIQDPGKSTPEGYHLISKIFSISLYVLKVIKVDSLTDE